MGNRIIVSLISIMMVNPAFKALCDWVDIEGLYFYNSDHQWEWVWGKEGMHAPDSLDRGNIVFESTLSPPVP